MKVKTSTAFIVRVVRHKAGVEIPFDKIYLFRKQDEARLPRIFRDAMVFPLTKRFVDQIEEVLKSYTRPYEAFPYMRGREDSLRRRVRKEDLLKTLQNNRKNFVALVPVLFTKKGSSKVPDSKKRMKGHKKEATFPAYLVARPALERTVSKLKSAMTSRAYFIINSKIIRPICLMCPLHQNFLQGQCRIGEEDCYRFLARAKTSDLVEGVRLYDQHVSSVQEPLLDLKGDENVQLP